MTPISLDDLRELLRGRPVPILPPPGLVGEDFCLWWRMDEEGPEDFYSREDVYAPSVDEVIALVEPRFFGGWRFEHRWYQSEVEDFGDEQVVTSGSFEPSFLWILDPGRKTSRREVASIGLAAFREAYRVTWEVHEQPVPEVEWVDSRDLEGCEKMDDYVHLGRDMRRWGTMNPFTGQLLWDCKSGGRLEKIARQFGVGVFRRRGGRS